MGSGISITKLLIIIRQLHFSIAEIMVQSVHVKNRKRQNHILCTTIVGAGLHRNRKCAQLFTLERQGVVTILPCLACLIPHQVLVHIDVWRILTPRFQNGIRRNARVEHPLGHQIKVIVCLVVILSLGDPPCAQATVTIENITIILESGQEPLFDRPRAIVLIDISEFVIKSGRNHEIVVIVDAVGAILQAFVAINRRFVSSCKYITIEHAVHHHCSQIIVLTIRDLWSWTSHVVSHNACRILTCRGNVGITVAIDDASGHETIWDSLNRSGGEQSHNTARVASASHRTAENAAVVNACAFVDFASNGSGVTFVIFNVYVFQHNIINRSIIYRTKQRLCQARYGVELSIKSSCKTIDCGMARSIVNVSDELIKTIGVDDLI